MITKKYLHAITEETRKHNPQSIRIRLSELIFFPDEAKKINYHITMVSKREVGERNSGTEKLREAKRGERKGKEREGK